jgi:hypothetical protein
MRVPLPLLLSSLVACASSPSSPTAPPPRPAQVINATILVNGCTDLGQKNAKLAESAMNQLVEGCTSVPGGSTQFMATLQPGGRIDIQPVEGKPDVVPICILKHALVHKVQLVKPCNLDVKIEQGTVNLPPVDAGAE